MASADNNEFVKLHSLTSETCLLLNGTTGRLGQHIRNFNGRVGNDRYEVFVGSPQRTYYIKVENMYDVTPDGLRKPCEGRLKIACGA